MQFYVWYDDTPKKTTADKVSEAIAAYVARFQTRPNLMLMSEADHTEHMVVSTIELRSERTVQPNSFWIAHEDGAAVPATNGEV